MIELLFVIAIISVLAGTVLSTFGEGRKESQDRVALAEIGSIRLSLDAYRSDCGVYPESLSLEANNNGRCDNTFGDFYSGGIDLDKFYYVAFRDENVDQEFCTEYHIGVELKTPHGDLEKDSDINSITDLSSNMRICSPGGWQGGGGGEAFDGSLPQIYDVYSR